MYFIEEFSMKNLSKLFKIIALVAAIGFSIAACDNGTTNGGGSTYLFNGVWERNGMQITVSGSTGVIKALGSGHSSAWPDAMDKGYVKIGDQYWRNISSTGNIIAGNLTWSGQCLRVTYHSDSPDVATGTTWRNCTFSLSANGQTVTRTTDNGEVRTYTRKQ
jgi:predicted small secreted protein